MSLYKKNHVPSVKTSTKINSNRTCLKEFININIYINVYTRLKKKKNLINKIIRLFFIVFNHDFFQPCSSVIILACNVIACDV